MGQHYEARLQRDLDRIRHEVGTVGQTVESAVRRAVEALLARDEEAASKVILGDLAVNRRVRRLDARCHAFVARHLPSAGHLRFISAVLRMDVALERVGDYAVTIAREAVQLSALPSPTISQDIRVVAEQALGLLHQALAAFAEHSAEQARSVLAMAAARRSSFHQVFTDLRQEGEAGEHPLADLFALLVVVNRLSRVGDQAKNLCEETVFAATGETKAPKHYRVLFVDASDDCYTQMAVAYARKAFPEQGEFSSAGWEPAEALETRCALLLDRQGYNTADLQPGALDTTYEALSRYHVIVSLGGDLHPHLPEIPFHSIYVRWDPGPQPAGLDQERAERLLADGWRQMVERIGDLMETLHGEEST